MHQLKLKTKALLACVIKRGLLFIIDSVCFSYRFCHVLTSSKLAMWSLMDESKPTHQTCILSGMTQNMAYYGHPIMPREYCSDISSRQVGWLEFPHQKGRMWAGSVAEWLSRCLAGKGHGPILGNGEKKRTKSGGHILFLPVWICWVGRKIIKFEKLQSLGEHWTDADGEFQLRGCLGAVALCLGFMSWRASLLQEHLQRHQESWGGRCNTPQALRCVSYLWTWSAPERWLWLAELWVHSRGQFTSVPTELMAGELGQAGLWARRPVSVDTLKMSLWLTIPIKSPFEFSF